MSGEDISGEDNLEHLNLFKELNPRRRVSVEISKPSRVELKITPRVLT
jgi:hypothetical protein